MRTGPSVVHALVSVGAKLGKIQAKQYKTLYLTVDLRRSKTPDSERYTDSFETSWYSCNLLLSTFRFHLGVLPFLFRPFFHTF